METVLTDDGARIAVHRRPGTGPTVLAVHGLSANAVAWHALLDALPEADVVLVDLRGRGASSPGPTYGMPRHADDLAAVVEQLTLGPVVAVGHSMGAYVVSQLAVRHPALVRSLVWVDGGITYDLPPGTDLQAVLAGVLAPVLAKLQRRWASPGEYLAYWAGVPAFAGIADDPYVEAYLCSDIEPDGDDWVAVALEAAVRADFPAMCEPHLKSDLARLTQPLAVVRAEHGVLTDPAAPDLPVLAQPLLDELATLVPTARVTTATGTNHYSVTLTAAGAAAVAAAVRSVL